MAASPHPGPQGRTVRGRVRDSSRSAVYAAEHQVARLLKRAATHPVVEVAGSHLTLPAERTFGSLAAVQNYVDRVLTLAWVQARWPEAAERPVTVRPRRGSSKAHYEFDTGVIALPEPTGADAWAMRELVVLHEVAHHLGAVGPDRAAAPHGAEFTGRLVILADHLLGPEVAFLLRVMFADQQVPVG